MQKKKLFLQISSIHVRSRKLIKYFLVIRKNRRKMQISVHIFLGVNENADIMFICHKENPMENLKIFAYLSVFIRFGCHFI